MSVLKDLEPGNVFQFFEEICEIPHGSGNIKQISNYLVKFAEDRNLFHIQDEYGDVIIVKDATAGYENVEPVIIQGHMDMVAVSTLDAGIDMKKEGLRLAIDGDYIYAKDTSLGGDDGIAVAYALAVLDSDTLAHPRIEVVITVDEETGMDGAREIDLSMLKAKRMLNIDSEDEGYLLTSCAGGASFNCMMPVERRYHDGCDYTLKVSGLLGGHSGAEIDKERGNANFLLARVLYHVNQKTSFHVYEVTGGSKENVIPNYAEVSFIMKEKYLETFKEELSRMEAELKNELKIKDPGFTLTLKENSSKTVSKLCICKEDEEKVIELSMVLPNGIYAMSASVKGLVETSLNLGVIESESDHVSMHYSVRSSIESKRELLIDQLIIICKIYGADFEVSGRYPGWEYRTESPLRDKMVDIYQRMYGKEMIVNAIHAGVECGFFADKIKDLDCVSFGPDMKDIHSVNEKLSISSTKRVWEYIVEVLKEK